jgi:two-component system sensor histidine kinase KdpD
VAASRVRAWLWWVGLFVVATVVLRACRDGLDVAHAVLTYLLVMLGGSVSGGRPLGFALTGAEVLSLDFFFQQPYDTLTVAKPLDGFVLLAFLTTAAVTTELLAAERARAAEAELLAAERTRLVAVAEHAEALREADRLKDVVLASVSHDLRTPLTTIKALAQAGARQGDQNAIAIEEQADRLARLVADLLDLSRLQGGALPVHPEPNTAEDLVGAALRQVAGLLGDRTVETKIEFTEPALVGRFDFVQTLRVLTNLIGNAIRYSPSRSPIELSVQREGERLVFAVADRGPGIPPADRERIFEPFYRPASAVAGSGAGLGLAIARRLAELQGGTIEYTERPGGGSVFALRLPADGAPEPL